MWIDTSCYFSSISWKHYIKNLHYFKIVVCILDKFLNTITLNIKKTFKSIDTQQIKLLPLTDQKINKTSTSATALNRKKNATTNKSLNTQLKNKIFLLTNKEVKHQFQQVLKNG